MPEFGNKSMPAEHRIDPASRDGAKRILAMFDAEGQVQLIRDCLRAVARTQAIAMFNQHVIGLRLPATADRGRMTTMLKSILRAGRPDAFECLQALSSSQVEEALSEKQFEAYGEAVDALNEAAEAGDEAKIAEAAGPVVDALRAGLDDATLRRYVILQALPETIEPLLAHVEQGAAPAAKTAAKKTATKKTAAKKTATKKTATKKTKAKKATAKKAAKDD